MSAQRTRGLLDSANYAFEGIIHVLRTQRNMRIHFAVALVVIVLATAADVSKIELAVLFISIAFVLAVLTSAVPKNVLFRVVSGLADHISTAQLSPFIANMHTALWCLCAVSLVGAVISGARPKEIMTPVAARSREPQAVLS